jgi:branched-chain amino acid transport system substrate-binding protein
MGKLKKRSIGFGAALLLAATALAACGSSSSTKSGSATSAGGNASSGSAAAAATGGSSSANRGSPYLIGFECTCTGPFASSTAIQDPVISAWASYENANGGIDGHSVKLIKMDDANNATTSLSEVTKLVEEDHVLAIIDGSNVDSGWATYVEQHNVPVVGDQLDSAAMFTNPDFFPEGLTENNLAPGLVAGAKIAGVTKLGVAYCTAVAACAEVAQTTKAAAEAVGLKVPYVSKIADSASNYTASCLAASQAGADGVNVASGETVLEAYANSCAAQGYHPKYVEVEGTATNAVLGLSSLNGMMDVEADVSATDTSSPGIQTMIAALNKYEPGTVTSATYGPDANQAWDAGILLATAAEAGHLGDNPTSAQLLNGLYSLQSNTLGGLAPPLTFHRGQPANVNCWFYAQIEQHQFASPYGDKYYCPAG